MYSFQSIHFYPDLAYIPDNGKIDLANFKLIIKAGVRNFFPRLNSVAKFSPTKLDTDRISHQELIPIYLLKEP